MMKFAYADPPYPGMAHLYRKHPDYGGEVDHELLVLQLEAEFPDGWALSTASVTLMQVLRLCPPDVRIGAWVKTFASFKPGVNPGYCWEPVIFHGGRRLGRDVLTVRDWVACPIALKRGLVGAKPEAVAFWIFQMLGSQPTDTMVDLFPGTGAVAHAWERYCHQLGVRTNGKT